MFLLTDLTTDFPVYKSNDTKDIGDIVVNITGSVSMGRAAEAIASYMRFGDEFISPHNFMLHCITEVRGE